MAGLTRHHDCRAETLKGSLYKQKPSKVQKREEQGKASLGQAPVGRTRGGVQRQPPAEGAAAGAAPPAADRSPNASRSRPQRQRLTCQRHVGGQGAQAQAVQLSRGVSVRRPQVAGVPVLPRPPLLHLRNKRGKPND